MKVNLRGKTILVTGAANGPGRAIACAFATAGAKVAIQHWGRRDEAADTAQLVRSPGGESITIEADASRSDLVDVMVAQVINRLGAIDILVNNAAVPSYRPVLRTLASWNDVLKTDIDSIYYCCHAVLPQMLRNRSGLILNVAADCEAMRTDHGQWTAALTARDKVVKLTTQLEREVAPTVQVRALIPQQEQAGTAPAARSDVDIARAVMAMVMGTTEAAALRLIQ